MRKCVCNFCKGSFSKDEIYRAEFNGKKVNICGDCIENLWNSRNSQGLVYCEQCIENQGYGCIKVYEKTFIDIFTNSCTSDYTCDKLASKVGKHCKNCGDLYYKELIGKDGLCAECRIALKG